jgi:hypothetical protein
MGFLTSLILVFGFALAICLGVVEMTWDLAQLSIHDSPAFPETASAYTGTQQPAPKATEPYQPNPAQLSDTS